MLVPPALLRLGPTVIGGTGGSGTRVVARILQAAGLFIGSELNESEDALRFGEYSDIWIDRYLPHRDEVLPAGLEQAMLEDLASVLGLHCAPLTPSPRQWGWKEPRSIYLLPFFHQHLPTLRFLHVVRDGRDMAVSSNQNQLQKHGDTAPIPRDIPAVARSIALWSWVNLEAAKYGGGRLGDRYLRVRFEDLCRDPAGISARICEFVGVTGDPHSVLDELRLPVSLGRWRTQDAPTIALLEQVGGRALRELGYATRRGARPDE